MSQLSHIYFLITPDVHMMDLAGPCQTFHEAKSRGLNLTLHFISPVENIKSHEGLTFSDLSDLPESINEHALIIVCGSNYYDGIYTDSVSQQCIAWLQSVLSSDIRVLGVCTGAFLLGHAGLLDQRTCTTHHQRTEELARVFPTANVLPNRIYVQDKHIYTSAGVAAGIDLALALIQQSAGAQFAVEVARELVVSQRRMAHDPQLSQQVSYRNHIQPLIHDVQDYLQSHLTHKLSVTELSTRFRISTRHLQREFKLATGLTVRDYLVELRLEVAKNYLDQGCTIESSAYQAGFPDAKALRTAWKRKLNSALR